MADLFRELQKLQAELHQSDTQSTERGVIKFPPEIHQEGSRRIFQNLKTGGFATFVVPGREGWNPNSAYFKEARSAVSNKNIDITRLLILPHLHYMREQTLYDHWDLDRQAGITVEFSVLGKEILDLLELFSLTKGTLDFGIWDNQIVSWYVSPTNIEEETPQWIISNRDVDIELGKKIRNLLMSQDLINSTPRQAQAKFALTEPLLQSAPMSDMFADFLCEGSHIDDENCIWYHKAWQYLRILDLVSTPSWHSEFYLGNMIRSVDSNKKQRILISGTADYSTLAYVLEAFRKKTRSLEIVVLDLCQTPLHLCKWYAAKENFEIQTVHENLLNYKPREGFDFIVADAFLTRFDDEMKRAIVDKWNDLLNPEGRVVTTIRTLDNRGNGPIKASISEYESFAETAYNLSVIWRDFVQKKPEYIKDLALNYAKRIDSWSLDRPSVLTLFKEAGFRIERSDSNAVKGEMKSTIYLEIIAVKLEKG